MIAGNGFSCRARLLLALAITSVGCQMNAPVVPIDGDVGPQRELRLQAAARDFDETLIEACLADERRATDGSPDPQAFTSELPNTGCAGSNHTSVGRSPYLGNHRLSSSMLQQPAALGPDPRVTGTCARRVFRCESDFASEEATSVPVPPEPEPAADTGLQRAVTQTHAPGLVVVTDDGGSASMVEAAYFDESPVGTNGIVTIAHVASTPSTGAIRDSGPYRSGHAYAPKNPNDPQVPISAAVAALRDGNPELAIDLLEPALGVCAESAALYRILGTAYYRRGDFHASQVTLQQALSLDKSSALSYFLMGCTLAKLGRLEAAEEHFRRAAAIDPKYAGFCRSG
jgi:hypothetical protein